MNRREKITALIGILLVAAVCSAQIVPSVIKSGFWKKQGSTISPANGESVAIGTAASAHTTVSQSGVTVYDTNGSTVKFSVDGSGKTYVGGKMGVGTSDPSYSLDVLTTLNEFGMRLSGTVDNVQLRLYSTASGGRAYDLISTGNTAGDGAGKFLIKNGGVARLSVDGVGGVGINTNAPTSGVTLDVRGPVAVGGGTAPISGVTSALTFSSGVSPTGSMTEGAIIYGTNGQLWANGTAGDHTQLTAHIDGKFVLNSFNTWTGEGKQIDVERWISDYMAGKNTKDYIKTYTVPKFNPEVEAKKTFVVKYQKANPVWVASTKTEATEPKITEETLYEVVQVKTLDPKDGTVLSTTERKPYSTMQTQEGYKLKEGFRVNTQTGAYEKKTAPSVATAEAACPPFDWKKMPKPVQEAWGK